MSPPRRALRGSPSRAGAAAALSCAMLSADTWADDGGRESVYTIRPTIDLPVLGLGLAGTSLAALEVPPSPCLPDCRPPSDLNAIDEKALGKYSTGSLVAADVLVAGLVAGPPVWSILDTGEPLTVLEDSIVYGQALTLTQGLTQLAKWAVRRPAPLVYDQDAPWEARTSRDGGRAFWSGHTATAFAAATTTSVTYWLRHPRDPYRFTILATHLSAAAAVGLLKVDAGYHYYSDVAVGALVGTSIGVLVPMLHTDF